MGFRVVLPLPSVVFHPLTSVGLGAVHAYLAAGHLGALASGDIAWTHVWKGFGALAGAYIFAALASRGIARPEHRDETQREGGRHREPGPKPQRRCCQALANEAQMTGE